MNALNTSNDDVVECPLCMEPLEVDDLNFYPCTCGYQICRFCWHRIRTDENELCPACRKAYPENPADFTPLSQEQISALKAEKRQRDQQRKQKITENRKHLANVRVVQKNLVFVVGLPPRLADADILKKHEYFGKYGKIHKVVINPSTTYAGVQGPSASAYVTYIINNDALRAIQSVNNIMIDGRLIKTSLGTTKYCSHFMKNQQCPKTDCMYLHELGDPEASFTKEEMHQGKHQEYEKRLHDTLIAATAANPCGIIASGTNGIVGVTGTTIINSNNKNGDTKLTNGTVPAQNQEAWPSLSVSPVNNKDSSTIVNINSVGKNSAKSGKENKKHDKTKSEKSTNGKKKTQNNNHNKENNNNNNNSNSNNNQVNGTVKEPTATDSTHHSTVNKKDKHSTNKDLKMNNVISADDELNLIEYLEANSEEGNSKNSDTRSFSTSSTNSESTSSLSESTSGKSSPGSFPDHPGSAVVVESSNIENQNNSNISSLSIIKDSSAVSSAPQANGVPIDESSKIHNLENEIGKIDPVSATATITNGDINNIIDTTACLSKLNLFDDNNSFFSSSSFQPLIKSKLDSAEYKTNLNNQLNSTISSQLPDLLNGIDGYQNNTTNNVGGSTHGNNFNEFLEKYILSTLNTTEDWEDAFKCVMLRNNKQVDEQLQQEEFLRIQEMRKRNNMINSSNGGTITNGISNDFNNVGNLHTNAADVNRLSQSSLFQLHQDRQQQNNMHNNDILANSIFGTNMSKFFDFHKNQQQQHHQQQHFIGNGHGNALNEHRDHLPLSTYNLLDMQFHDQQNGLMGQQKSGLLNKYNQVGGTHNHNLNINPNSNLQQQQPLQNRIPNQYTHNISADDDLGFDPFIETQKGLAEMMENEMLQQSQNQNGHNKHLLDNGQRTRMPPPGFNHMNSFGFGVPRPQNSKILPFMNVNVNNGPANNVGPLPHPAQLQQNNWNQHMGFQQQQQQQQQQHQQQINEQQMHLNQQNPIANGGNHNKGFGNIQDWTAMDPAILSFRQFPSFSSHQHQQQQHNNASENMFMQHLNQQNLQQNQSFGHLGVNLPNNLLNPQQNAQAQVNLSHSNWLNNEQNLFMNSFTNNNVYKTNNNYDKFSIPVPPGLHPNNLKHKTECN